MTRAEGELIDTGGCADVIMFARGKALKAFRRISYSHDPVMDWADHCAITRAKYRAEARAYRQLQQIPELAKYVPQFYGTIDPTSLPFVRDAAKYVPGCGLILEFVPGSARKLAHVDKSIQDDVASVVTQLEATLGLKQGLDASCFVPGASGSPFTVIDFAYWDAGEYEMAIAKRFKLSASERELLERENTN